MTHRDPRHNRLEPLELVELAEPDMAFAPEERQAIVPVELGKAFVVVAAATAVAVAAVLDTVVSVVARQVAVALVVAVVDIHPLLKRRLYKETRKLRR